ncbi:MAG: TonB family protein [Gammaproteobacteria bacterium]|nr:TonB family protein [Gammaproteobacteria bacterium]
MAKGRGYRGVPWGYYQREDPQQWEKEDRGIREFYVYILEIDRPPTWYVGQTKDPRQRWREHAAAPGETMAGATARAVYIEQVLTRAQATTYEWALKRMQKNRPEHVVQLVRRGDERSRRLMAKLGIPEGERTWGRAADVEAVPNEVAREARSASLRHRQPHKHQEADPGQVVRHERRRAVFGLLERLGLLDVAPELGSVAVLLALVAVVFWSSDGTVKTQEIREREEALVEHSEVAGAPDQEAGAAKAPGSAPAAQAHSGSEPVVDREYKDSEAPAAAFRHIGDGLRLAGAGDVVQGSGSGDGMGADPQSPPSNAEPARVGGEIQEPTRTVYVQPVYPEIAKRARVSGVVVLEATIDPEGNVSKIGVLRSIPLLDQAAVEAVRQWKYEPTLLNGVPAPVVLTVTVTFNLG